MSQTTSATTAALPQVASAPATTAAPQPAASTPAAQPTTPAAAPSTATTPAASPDATTSAAPVAAPTSGATSSTQSTAAATAAQQRQAAATQRAAEKRWTKDATQIAGDKSMGGGGVLLDALATILRTAAETHESPDQVSQAIQLQQQAMGVYQNALNTWLSATS